MNIIINSCWNTVFFKIPQKESDQVSWFKFVLCPRIITVHHCYFHIRQPIFETLRLHLATLRIHANGHSFRTLSWSCPKSNRLLAQMLLNNRSQVRIKMMLYCAIARGTYFSQAREKYANPSITHESDSYSQYKLKTSFLQTYWNTYYTSNRPPQCAKYAFDPDRHVCLTSLGVSDDKFTCSSAHKPKPPRGHII